MDKINKNPEIRFKGFEQDWVESNFNSTFRSLSNNTLSRADLNYETGLAKNIHYGDVLIKFNEILDVQSNEIPFISNNELVDKFRTSKLQNGDVIFADAAEDETVGKCTEIININNEIVFPGLHTIAVRPTFLFASKYLGYYLNSPAYHNQLLRLMQGTKVSSISKSAIKNTSIFHPKDTTEQKQIGSFFQNLDNLITLHQKKYEKLIILKKAMLVKMFPKKGALVPEIRFKGFSGDWVETRLGEIVPLRGGFAFKSDNFIINGIPIVKISNILPSGQIGGKFSYYKEVIADENYMLPNNAALLAMSGATTGKVSILSNPTEKKVYQNQRVGYFEDRNLVNYQFISAILRSNLFSDKINSILTTGAQPNISSKEIDFFEFYVPTDRLEQQKVGDYFKNLDNQIVSHKTQLDKLNIIKKACFSKMFVAQD